MSVDQSINVITVTDADVAPAPDGPAVDAVPIEFAEVMQTSDTWSRDEREYNDDSHPPVYTPQVEDHIMSQSEILARASGDGVQYIQEQRALCFDGDRSDQMAMALRLSEVDMGTIERSDPVTIDSIFKMKVELIHKAMDDIQKDPSVTQDQKVEIFGAARVVDAMLMRANDILLAIIRMNQCVQSSLAGQLGSDAEAVWRYMPKDDSDTENAMQKLYRIAFERAKALELARYKENFMRRVKTPEGMITNAWQVHMSIKDFVYDLTSIADPQIQFLSKRTVNIMDDVAKILIKTREPLLPWLKLDRHVFAFRNGCYLAKDQLFIRFSKCGPPMMPNGTPCPMACKYHDCELDERWLYEPDPANIPTPTVDLIMNTQNLSEDVKRTYRGMLGRALYNLGEMDNWQVLLYVKGQAETGKSTLLKFVSSFYNAEDVGILASNIEATFGASMLTDKFLVVGDDLQEDLQLNQQLFNNFATGQDVSLPVKNGDAKVIKWVTQLLLSGNVIPGYKDNAGSFSRRLIIVHYAIPVAHVDPTLPDKLNAEVAAAIVKFNRSYLNMIRRIKYMAHRPAAEGGSRQFWDAIPEEFRVQKRNLMQSSNSFMSFFHSGQLAYGPTLYMPRALFTSTFMTYCSNNNVTRPRFQPTTYEGPFKIMSLRMTTKSTQRYPRNKDGRDITDQWVLGCDLSTGEVLSAATADHIRAAEKAQKDYVSADHAKGAADKSPAPAAAPKKRKASEIVAAAAAVVAAGSDPSALPPPPPAKSMAVPADAMVIDLDDDAPAAAASTTSATSAVDAFLRMRAAAPPPPSSSSSSSSKVASKSKAPRF